MRVLKRVLVKSIILLLIIAVFGGGAAAWQAYRQSTPEYAMERYLSLLIDNKGEAAYDLLDQSENEELTKEEYAEALTARKYSLYSGFQTKAGEKRRDNSGNEYMDFHAEFMDAAEEVQLEDDFTVKKQAKAVFGIFDSWKVLASHCMVENYGITVPTGSEVYLNNVLADASWIGEQMVPACDTYVIPSVVPGTISLTVRHPALESVNTTLDVTEGDADYSQKMKLKESAQSECKEIGVRALKTLFTSAVKDEYKDDENLFAECKSAAQKFAEDQAKIFRKEDAALKNVGVSDFAAQFGEVTFAENDKNAITVEMKFSYHYAVREETTTDTGEVYEDGTPITETETSTLSGDATAKFTMAFYEGEWHIASMEIPVIPE